METVDAEVVGPDIATEDDLDGVLATVPGVSKALEKICATTREQLVEDPGEAAMELALPENRGALELIARAVLTKGALEGDDEKIRISAAKEILASYRGEANVNNFVNIFDSTIMAKIA